MVRDVTDANILKILQKNSRLSYAQIGREINLSPSAVGERVQRMEDEGVIERYLAVVNPRKVGYTMEAFISMTFEGNKLAHFLEVMKDFSEIHECSRVTGQACMIMKVVLRDNLHLENLIDRLMPFGTPVTSVVLSNLVKNKGFKEIPEWETTGRRGS